MEVYGCQKKVVALSTVATNILLVLLGGEGPTLLPLSLSSDLLVTAT